MHNAKSGARKQRASRGTEELLSPHEAADLARGQVLKRYVRAAAALNDLFDDASLADTVGIGRGAVAGWWRGAKPTPDTIFRLAGATGLSPDELMRFLYQDGPPPALAGPGSPVEASVREGLRRDQRRQPPEDPDTPSQSPERQTRDSEAGRA